MSAAQRARLDAAAAGTYRYTDCSLADLHERLGNFVKTGNEIVAGGHKWDGREPSNLRGLEIETAVRPSHFKADDTPEIRALQADWDETGRLMDAARERFYKHRSPRLYRMECRQIIAREA
jgi:hypothetical protein